MSNNDNAIIEGIGEKRFIAAHKHYITDKIYIKRKWSRHRGIILIIISELTIKQDVARKALPCKRRKEGETDKKGSFCQPELLMRQVAIIIRRQTTSEQVSGWVGREGE